MAINNFHPVDQHSPKIGSVREKKIIPPSYVLMNCILRNSDSNRMNFHKSFINYIMDIVSLTKLENWVRLVLNTFITFVFVVLCIWRFRSLSNTTGIKNSSRLQMSNYLQIKVIKRKAINIIV